MKTLLIILDACSSNYIQDNKLPLLKNIISNSTFYSKIIPSEGFCERLEIFSGVKSSDHNLKSAYEINLNKKHSLIFNMLHCIETTFQSKLISKLIRRGLWSLRKIFKLEFHPIKIPLNLLSYVYLTEDGKNGILNKQKKSLVNYSKNPFMKTMVSLDKKSISSDNERIKTILKNARKNYDFQALYIGELDAIGHKYGINSKEINLSLSKIDKNITTLLNKLKKNCPELNIAICGDHGMTNVTIQDDTFKYLQKNYKKEIKNKDIFIFVDSIYLKVFITNNYKKKENSSYKDLIKYLIEKQNQSHVLSVNQTFHKNNNNHYKKITIELQEGSIFHPCYFADINDTPPKGMHGYKATNNKLMGFFSIMGPNIPKKTITTPTNLAVTYQELLQSIKSK